MWKVIKSHVQKKLLAVNSRQDYQVCSNNLKQSSLNLYSWASRIHSATNSFCYCAKRTYNKILKRQVNAFVEIMLFTMFEFNWQKNESNVRAAAIMTLLATRCTSLQDGRMFMSQSLQPTGITGIENFSVKTGQKCGLFCGDRKKWWGWGGDEKKFYSPCQSTGCAKKFYRPEVFLIIFPKRLKTFKQNFTRLLPFRFTLTCKILFNYLQLWQSYAVLSATTHRIFTFHNTSITSFTNWR